MKRLLASLGLLIASMMAFAETPEDPYEDFNRSMFSFNETVDKYALKPIAKGYDAVTPNAVQKGVSNFFSNLGEIPNTFNNLLQGKWDETASSTFRFVVNSTFGVFGLFDVASEMGLKQYKEDFGQTLGYWGVDSGPYLMLPFFGPSTVRDASGMVVDYSLYDGLDLYDVSEDDKWAARGLNVIQLRAKYLSAENMVFGDRYSFIRDVYLQSRAGDVGVTKPSNTNVVDPDNASIDSGDSWGDESAGDSWGDTP